MNNEALKSLADKLANEQKSLQNHANKMINDFNKLMNKFDFMKEKKTKINKMPATIMMNVDKSIMIVFDNPEDAEKFYGK